MKAAYFDPFAGASGDMILGALVDAGLPLERLKDELAKLHLPGYRLEARRERRGPLSGIKLTVVKEGQPPPRNLADIVALIGAADLADAIKEKAIAIFNRLAQAEAKVHGVTTEEVHFHEVGAVDAIVDVVGAVIGFHLLGVEAIYCGPLPGGGGTVSGEHGQLPIPAPATLELIAMAKAPLRPTPSGPLAQSEAVTPTGAAIITTLASFSPPPTMTLHAVGYGLGSRDNPELPNALRLWLGQAAAEPEQGEMILLETNIDDMPAEVFGYVQERLFELGARDVWFSPIQMKKNRPATLLSALVPISLEGVAVEAILRETSTLGIRSQPVQRWEAERESVEFESSLGRASAKLKRWRGDVIGVSPEYEACRRLALEHRLPLQAVYRIITEETRSYLSQHHQEPKEGGAR